jgi:hypothetical protein
MTSKIVKVFFALMMAALTFCYGEQQLTIANFSFLLKKVRVLVLFFYFGFILITNTINIYVIMLFLVSLLFAKVKASLR